MTRHLLSCVHCGRDTPVTIGQAGDQVACGGCGTVIDVPRLGDLTRLPRAAGEPGRRRPQARWTPAHAWLWTGLVIAGLSSAAAVVMRSPSRPAIDEAVIRTAVRAGSIVDVHQAWKGFYRHGVGRPPTAEEQTAVRRAQARGAIVRVLLLAALAGAVLTAGGAVALALSQRGSSDDGPVTTTDGRRR
jgi:hypothetical protein